MNCLPRNIPAPIISISMTFFYQRNWKYLFIVCLRVRRHIKNSCFVLHRGIQIPGNKKSTRASVSCFHLFRGVWISQWSNSRSFLIHYFPLPRNAATSKIGNGVSSSLWQLRCHCNPDHYNFSSLSNTAVEVIFPNSYRAFSLAWLTSMQIFGTKGSVCIRKEFNSHRIGLGHQHGRRFIVLRHQYGRRDVMWKHSINGDVVYAQTWEVLTLKKPIEPP